MTIYKYPLTSNKIKYALPLGVKFLDIQVQRAIPCMWFEVDLSKDKEDRLFCLIPTGVEFDDTGMHYLGTFQEEETFVMHLYEEIRQ